MPKEKKNIKELSNEELENVSGGSCDSEPDPDDPSETDHHFSGYSGFVNKYCLQTGCNYYFVHVQNRSWFYGTLLDSYESGHMRMHRIMVISKDAGGSEYNYGDEKKLEADWYACYTTKTN